jgi:D-alanyl-D-alanine dipeptidase
MSQTKYIFLIILPLLTIFYDCRSGAEPVPVVKNVDTVKSVVVEEQKINETENYLKNMGLVNVQDSLPDILVDLKYATDDNFLGFKFYGEMEHAFVQYECFLKLRNAYNILQKQKPGYTFIIYDAVRSIESQQLMWDSVKVEPAIKHWYVANPQRGSIHNYGMALDLSIVDSVGNVLDMGTEFDFFGDLAYPSQTDYYYNNGKLSKEQFENRKLLMSVMQQAYFYVSKTEWWHYNTASIDYSKSKYKIFSYPPKAE